MAVHKCSILAGQKGRLSRKHLYWPKGAEETLIQLNQFSWMGSCTRRALVPRNHGISGIIIAVACNHLVLPLALSVGCCWALLPLCEVQVHLTVCKCLRYSNALGDWGLHFGKPTDTLVSQSSSSVPFKALSPPSHHDSENIGDGVCLGGLLPSNVSPSNWQDFPKHCLHSCRMRQLVMVLWGGCEAALQKSKSIGFCPFLLRYS